MTKETQTIVRNGTKPSIKALKIAMDLGLKDKVVLITGGSKGMTGVDK